MKYYLTSFLLIALCFNCNQHNQQKVENYQNKRENISNVSNDIIDIKTDSAYGISLLYIIGDYLIIDENNPKTTKGIHIFDKNTFKLLANTGIRGKGPGEILNPGRICSDDKNEYFLVPDYGKMVIWKFIIDSVLHNELYKPETFAPLNNELFVDKFDLLNDSILIGKGVHVSNSKGEMTMLKYNLKTNVSENWGYQNKYTVGNKSSSFFALSNINNIYVNCYVHCNLMTICDLQGNLKHDIYGPGWNTDEKNTNSYYYGVGITMNNIIASYIGDVSMNYDSFDRPHGNLATKFLLFDLKGNYERTLETCYKFQSFCIDEENKRLIAYFDERENPLGYFNY